MRVVPDIPRFYTALSEWAACFVFVLLLQPRWESRWKRVLFSAGALVVQIVFMTATGNTLIYFWIPCMIVAVFLMIGQIYFCCRISFRDAAYLALFAFALAEFMASLEWQIVRYYLGDVMQAKWWARLFPLLLIYGCLLFAVWSFLSRRIPKDGRLEINNLEYASALVIGVAIFAMSNLSFLPGQTPFSGNYAQEIANIRTLVDFGGLAILYAHMVQCAEVRTRQELEAVQGVLQNQYMQYQLSKESIDLINYKYHDLKHQIGVLRSEMDTDRRNAFLNQMEEEIRMYEAQNKTGNKVLDTVLTSKSLTCAKNEITFTAVADGTLLDFMDAMDICSIFGNALDNAIECEKKIAEKEKRLIHVTVARQKSFLIIRVENYFEGDLKFREGSPATTKKNKKLHGYGIKSIRYTANRYDGALHISHRDNWFELQVLIPITGEKVTARL